MNRSVCRIETAGQAHGLWSYRVEASGHRVDIAPPVFEVDGIAVTASVTALKAVGAPTRLPNGYSVSSTQKLQVTGLVDAIR